MHKYTYAFAPDSPCLLDPLCIVSWIKGCTCVALCVCVSQSCLLWSHTLVRICTCIRTCMYVHLTAHVCCTTFKFTCKLGWPCAVLYECPSHCFSGLTFLLECAHASVHICMTSWLSMYGPPPWNAYMETTGASVWHCVCVCLSQPSSGHIPWLECVHASVHVYMCTWLTMCPWPHCIVTCKHGCHCVALSVCLSHASSCPTPWLEYVHTSVHVCAGETPLVGGETPLIGGERSPVRDEWPLFVAETSLIGGERHPVRGETPDWRWEISDWRWKTSSWRCDISDWRWETFDWRWETFDWRWETLCTKRVSKDKNSAITS